jgi:hypothetical protein
MVKATRFSQFSKLEGAPRMKKIAFAALFLGVASTGLLACGGDDDSGDITFADSGPGGDGGGSATCNPVTQQGCADGEKCSWLTVQNDDSGYLGRTDCVPDGTVAIGGECMDGTPGEETGFDDCAAGGLCVAGSCSAICTAEPDSCGADFACSFYSDLFTDDPNENLGVCDPTCDPITQDCPEDGQGCYLSLRNGKATCANVATGAEDLKQGEVCLHNDQNLCFLNGCAEGFGAFMYGGMNMPRKCSGFCSPLDTFLLDPDGDGSGTINDNGAANGAEPHNCSVQVVGGTSGQQCRFFQSYFIDMNNMFLEYVPDTYGFCLPKTADFGDCTKYSEEWFLETYNLFIEDGGAPEGWGDEITAQCDMRNGGCPFGCVTLAKMDELDTAYCTKPANADRPACAAGARGAKIVRRSLEKMWAEQMIKAGVLTENR